MVMYVNSDFEEKLRCFGIFVNQNLARLYWEVHIKKGIIFLVSC